MSRRSRLWAGVLAALAIGVAMPSAASAHAYLVKTAPVASRVLASPPKTVSLSFDEAVEPDFAIISVTDVNGTQETTAPVSRSPAEPNTLQVPVRPRLREGWYLIYWRAVSVDGHPVDGAFTYAIGPNPGPAPQFPVPHISATAVTAQLLIARWAMFLSVMSAIGLFVLRGLVAGCAVRRVPGLSLRTLSRGFVVASVLGLLTIPVYLDFAIANDSLRSVFDLPTLVPLFRATAFGRGYVDLELCFALFCVAAWVSLWVDRPDRDRRSVAELAANCGALLAAAAVLAIPGAVGHAGHTSPRGLAVSLDWLHLISGSVWLGGLIGILILWFGLPASLRVAGLSVVVPRFSNAAFASVLLLLATGTGATIIHMPTVSALWETGYGYAILVKIDLLAVALAMASRNLFRAKPRLLAARRRPELGDAAAGLLRRLVGGEAAIVAGAVFAAALLSSLDPPPPAFALQNSALASVGPGRVAETVRHAGYVLQVLVSPNKAAAPDSFALRITSRGRPVRRAAVTLTFNHLEMMMPAQEYSLPETRPGIYRRSAPALIMVGKWGLSFSVTPRDRPPFTALIVDQADG